MPNYQRTLPRTGVAYGKAQWDTLFSPSEKVAVYWPFSANTVTLVGYYSTVSAANTAAAAAVNASGAYPHVRINFWHSDFTNVSVAGIAHRDATASLPAWYDEEPAY